MSIQFGGLILSFGLAPKYAFDSVCCLALANYSKYLYMDNDQIEQVYAVLKVIVRDVEETVISNSFISLNELQAEENHLLCRKINELPRQDYCMINGLLTLFILVNDFRMAQDFVKSWSFIKQCQSILQQQIKPCQKFLVEALFAFVESEKTVLQKHAPTVRIFFMTVMGMNCSCVSNKMFLIAASFKWNEWFYFCAKKLCEMIHLNHGPRN